MPQEQRLSVEQLTKGEQRNSFNSKKFSVGISPDLDSILFFVESEWIGQLGVEKMSYNEFTYPDGNTKKSIQYLQMAKGKKGVDIFICDEEGEPISEQRIGEAMLKISIDNTAVMECVSKDHNIKLSTDKS